MEIVIPTDAMTHEEKRVLRGLVERTLGAPTQAEFTKPLDVNVVIHAGVKRASIIITI